MFSSVCALPSPASAEGCYPSLFGWFTGTTAQSDFSCTFMSAVRFMAFAERSWSVDQDAQDISRFSCMLFLSVRGFLDYAGPSNPLALTWLLCCLPPLGTESASCSIGFSKLNSPAHRYPCLRFKRYLAVSPARLEARMDSLLSFPVGLLHPLQHAGLARRSPACRPPSQNAVPYDLRLLNAHDDRIHYRLFPRRSPSPAAALKSITTIVTSSGKLWPFVLPHQLVI